MIITTAILSALLIVSLFIIWNLMKKNEILEDFVTKQSDLHKFRYFCEDVRKVKSHFKIYLPP